ncbi:hypothetical protein PM10SUCC1_32150 [Propionigenium maris DSM 9537]|uniref:Initiator Rep protein domain-containing protein n=1 Tax=Propionigenium maris DSM 9537 TaxID=1123000 RepID=A0A9W6GPL5_9FUSO|nr:replication initiation protein [Propionigenium maris]GLI57701.1 hypothetical protein PM10SUCC1_32150 [Propionigenium maris DSM 9537]
MINNSKKKKETVLNQHSALTTFKLKEGKYYKIGVEKSIFALLLRAQQDLRKKFKEGFTEKMKDLGVSQDKYDHLLENAFSNKKQYGIEHSEFDTEALTKVANEVLEFQEKGILAQTNNEDEIKRLTSNIQNGVLTKVADRQKQLLITSQEVDEIIGEIKRYCKDTAIKDYLDFKTVDFTALANSINTNSTMLKKDIKNAAKTVLEFNYINKKNLDVEVVSNLLASVRFTHDKKNNMTWLVYQIPREILELLLIPEVYVPLEGVVVHELTGTYTIRMYGLLKDHLKRGEVELNKEEMFNFFSLPKSYGNKTNLVKKFLTPTLEEVEKTSGIHTQYEFIPKNRYSRIKFFPVMKSQVKGEELKVIPKEEREEKLESNKKVLEEISKAKKNIYVSKAWNKRADNKIQKILREEGEGYAIFILKELYKGLAGEIKTTLVQYINGIMKNSPKDEVIDLIETPTESEVLEAEIIEEIPSQGSKEAASEPQSDPATELLYNMFLDMKKDKQQEIEGKAKELYITETNTKKFDKMHEKIFMTIKKTYIVKVLKKSIMGE